MRPPNRSARRGRVPRGLSLLVLALLGACAGTPVPSVMTHQHHRIDYVEFTVHDMAAAQRFYGEAFGWTFTDYGPTYAGIQRPEGGEVGGLRSDLPVTTGGPLVVLFSEDLEQSLGAVRAAGGTIVQEPFDFPGGRRFQFRDPSGNELAVWAEPQE